MHLVQRGRLGRVVEGIYLASRATALLRSVGKVGALEEAGDGSTNRFLLGRLRVCHLCFGLLAGPFGGEGTLALGQLLPSFAVVAVPEEKLQILGGMLDVSEVIHKIPDGAWLCRGSATKLVGVDRSSKYSPGRHHLQ